ncbi:hypothetical protein F4859DRAFT_526091 [Xylaria cf. heliscus]|nr:hypothetical protein F4859DRAFT_526091 [Xylaria cf. heliscus]
MQLAGLEAFTDDVWQQVPDHRVAFREYHENPLDNAQFEKLRQIFLKHHVEDRFGLILNHRHFDLRPGESLVECGAAATPWLLRDAPNIVRARVFPKTWGFFGGSLTPYEFGFSETPGHGVSPHVPLQFVTDLDEFLHSNALASRFGITALRETEGGSEATRMYETTIGRVSISVPQDAEQSNEDLVKFDGDHKCN